MKAESKLVEVDEKDHSSLHTRADEQRGRPRPPVNGSSAQGLPAADQAARADGGGGGFKGLPAAPQATGSTSRNSAGGFGGLIQLPCSTAQTHQYVLSSSTSSHGVQPREAAAAAQGGKGGGRIVRASASGCR